MRSAHEETLGTLADLQARLDQCAIDRDGALTIYEELKARPPLNSQASGVGKKLDIALRELTANEFKLEKTFADNVDLQAKLTVANDGVIKIASERDKLYTERDGLQTALDNALDAAPPSEHSLGMIVRAVATETAKRLDPLKKTLTHVTSERDDLVNELAVTRSQRRRAQRELNATRAKLVTAHKLIGSLNRRLYESRTTVLKLVGKLDGIIPQDPPDDEDQLDLPVDYDTDGYES
jgi:chromosome segregation ATPase